MGKQGLGSNCSLQMIYVSINMLRKIIVEGGLELYDKYHQIVVEMMLSNPKW